MAFNRSSDVVSTITRTRKLSRAIVLGGGFPVVAVFTAFWFGDDCRIEGTLPGARAHGRIGGIEIDVVFPKIEERLAGRFVLGGEKLLRALLVLGCQAVTGASLVVHTNARPIAFQQVRA